MPLVKHLVTYIFTNFDQEAEGVSTHQKNLLRKDLEGRESLGLASWNEWAGLGQRGGLQ